MTNSEFAATVTEQLKTSGWKGVQPHVHVLNLPDGWEEMIGGFFDSMLNMPLTWSIEPVANFTRQQLSWPEGDLPAPLDQVKEILVIQYSLVDGENKESAKLTLPLIEVEGAWKVALGA